MKNSKRSTKIQDPWGPSAVDSWTKENAQPVLHPYGCRCAQCVAGIKWAQEYMAKVNGR